MKFLCASIVFCVFVYFASASYKSFERFQEASKKCIKDLKLDEKAMDEYLKMKNHTTDDQDKKCYFKCVLEATEWMDKDGKITEPKDIDKDKDIPESYLKLLRECEDATGKDNCDKAYNFHVCSFDKTMKLAEAEKNKPH